MSRSRAADLRAHRLSSIHARALQVRRLACASVLLGRENFGSLTGNIPTRHGRSANVSDLLELSEQNSDMEFIGENIEAYDGLMATSEDASEEALSAMLSRSATVSPCHV
jgi:hypothetical protein